VTTSSIFLHLEKNIRIPILTNRLGDFLGLGIIRIGGIALRSGQRPFLVRLSTVDGWFYSRFRIRAIRKTGDGPADILLDAIGQPLGRHENYDDYGQPILELAPRENNVVDQLILKMAPVSMEMGGKTWDGFSYRLHFKSSARGIHRILTHATWEIGGRITGNIVLSQGQCNRPVYRGARNTIFTTACLKTLDQYGSPQGNSFQLGPRAGLIQGFDFQYSRAGILFQFWPGFQGGLSSLVESPKGQDLLHVIDEYRAPLSRDFQTDDKWIVFQPGHLAGPAVRDLWREAHEKVYGSVRKRFRIRPTLPLPDASSHCSSTVRNGELRCIVMGREVKTTEVLHAMGEWLIPQLARQGVRRYFPNPPVQESDVTILGFRRKVDGGVHGDLHCASVCSTHRFFPSEFWGGMKGWKHLVDQGHRHGMEIGAWFAPHFSPRAPIFVEHPEYRMIDLMGRPDGGGYGFHNATSADWNTGIYDWVLADIRRWKKEGGIDFLFVDSYSNLGLLQVNHSARMRTNFVALARLFRDFQRIGISSLLFEGMTSLGCPWFGLADLRGKRVGQNRTVAGQNDFGWWIGEEDMAYNCQMNVSPVGRTPLELERLMFRMAANRCYLQLDKIGDKRHRLPDWVVRQNRLYNQALPFMQDRRRVLPDGKGIEWVSSSARLVWTFRKTTIPLAPGVSVVEFDGQKESPIRVGGCVHLPPRKVVCIRGHFSSSTPT
jgi:hypothetical protein